ncbi:hypothetical protein [Candidatus Viadribacter manganicus]|uniref:Uncharacterized protein n=1 Tax=Candidatus Viadribacter manganicus TaxID=1759059 RepID=A0A1B1AH01_9PROT|nr:hypothetical protein [Candidatus Viadribacter manganicus]ANP45846.1 hypothetical protein ATE48_07860 [Candidatus Viadribacter manganicus]
MSFRIEYLKETTCEDSVCHALVSHGKTLEAAEEEAFAGADLAKQRGATGFQIRHLNAVDKIVVIADFNVSRSG